MRRKLNSFFAFLLAAILSACLFACGKKGEIDVTKITVDANAENNYVAISILEGALEGEPTLSGVMSALQEAEKLSFVLVSGMVTEINGVENGANYNPCWMLYTSDGEISSAQYGSYEYEGESLGSAVVGAESLTAKEGERYVWVYQSF